MHKGEDEVYAAFVGIEELRHRACHGAQRGSGNKAWVHWRYSCSKFVRQTFVEWATQTIPRSFWAKAYYECQRARGARHQAALRALAFKWIRILHRCWRDRVAYDESRYLMALQKRGAPLLKHAARSS